ncbi:MAG: Fic family protein [archaeon]|nr:Fic family protein [archaeon]
MKYPSFDKIVELNVLALNLIKVKNKDAAKVLSSSKILAVINECKNFEGAVYDKAVILLKGLVVAHAFASGNRRTAFLSMKLFLKENNTKLSVTDDPLNAVVLRGIRENYYSDNEIKEWLKNGKIRQFKR